MLIAKDKINDVVSKLKATGNIIVFTNGCFDILHAGHVRYLNEARKLGINVILPDINRSTNKYEVVDNGILFPLFYLAEAEGLVCCDFLLDIFLISFSVLKSRDGKTGEKQEKGCSLHQIMSRSLIRLYLQFFCRKKFLSP